MKGVHGNMTEKNKENTYFKDWYEDNKDRLSEARKQKYSEDEAYRERVKERARRSYWMKQRRARSETRNQVSLDDLELQPSTTLSVVVTDENDIRYGMTLDVDGYYPRVVAEALGRSTQTLRLWFLKGYLPEMTHRNAQGYRVYTEDQVRILVENKHWLAFSVQDFSLHPYFKLVMDGFDSLGPEGIERMDTAEWRLDPSGCPWCGGTPSLQFKTEDGWKHVECLNCVNPVDVHGRRGLHVYSVEGKCNSCGQHFDELVESSTGRFTIMCPRCSSRDVNVLQKHEVEDEGGE